MEKEQSSKPEKKAWAAQRIFEQHPDAISLYSDFSQIIGTGHEVLLQFYETIPGVPGPAGTPETVRTRLRATIIVSKAHALNMGHVLLEKSQKPPPVQEGR